MSVCKIFLRFRLSGWIGFYPGSKETSPPPPPFRSPLSRRNVFRLRYLLSPIKTPARLNLFWFYPFSVVFNFRRNLSPDVHSGHRPPLLEAIGILSSHEGLFSLIPTLLPFSVYTFFFSPSFFPSHADPEVFVVWSFPAFPTPLNSLPSPFSFPSPQVNDVLSRNSSCVTPLSNVRTSLIY